MSKNQKFMKKSFSQYVGSNNGRFPIDKFIKPVAQSEYRDVKEMVRLNREFKLARDDYLPLTNTSATSLYSFHSVKNENASYIHSPRLSVTKLLTDRWCELKEMYNVFAGSPTFVSAQMNSGTRFHESLEAELFDFQDVDKLESILNQIIESKTDDYQTRDAFEFNLKESEYAYEMTDNLIVRLFSLMTTSETRELLVHGFLDMNENKVLRHSKEIEDTNAVLVSGVVDHLRIYDSVNPGDLSAFESISTWIDYYSKKSSGLSYIDMAEFLLYVKEVFSKCNSQYRLDIADVKTRSFNRIPAQASVLRASRIQVLYYQQMFEILRSREDQILTSQASLKKLLKAKNLDLDAPISFKHVIILLRRHGHLLFDDLIKIKEGKDIGFPYSGATVTKHGSSNYDLSMLLNHQDIELLNSIEEDYDYNYLLNLLGPWKSPLTLRYFVARSASMYNSFENVNMGSPSIEYHNSKTGLCFDKIIYNYDSKELDDYTESASKFWNGTRQPRPPSDISRCKACLYKQRCPVPNNVNRFFDVGFMINDFIEKQ